MQGIQKPPVGALHRQDQHLQDARQHRILGYIPQMIQARESHINRQHRAQKELVDGHGAREPIHPDGFFDQLLEFKFL
jgi:hypothetical protein